MEQSEFDFESKFENKKSPNEMTDAELVEEYKKRVGVSPRTDSHEELLNGVLNPIEEVIKLRAIDKKSDLDDLLIQSHRGIVKKN